MSLAELVNRGDEVVWTESDTMSLRNSCERPEARRRMYDYMYCLGGQLVLLIWSVSNVHLD